MTLQWTPIRLSMVSGQNGVTQIVRPNLRTTYRKMADFGVQVNCDEELMNMSSSPPTPPPSCESNCNIAVAEINTSGDPQESITHNHHRPLSLQSSTSSNSSGEERERRRLQTEEDVDAICVQQTESCAEEDATAQLQPETTELDGGFKLPPQQYDKEDPSCGLDCITFTMQCCECTIL